jgi:hypothetical protein
MSRLALLPHDLQHAVHRKLHASLMVDVHAEMAELYRDIAMLRCAPGCEWHRQSDELWDMWLVSIEMEDGRRLMCTIRAAAGFDTRIEVVVGAPRRGTFRARGHAVVVLSRRGVRPGNTEWSLFDGFCGDEVNMSESACLPAGKALAFALIAARRSLDPVSLARFELMAKRTSR